MNAPEEDPTRRRVLTTAAGLATLAAIGCKGSTDPDSGDDTSKPGDSGPTDSGPTDSGLPDLGRPEIGADLWQTQCAYGRASADRTIGTRIQLYNPAEATQRVLIQVFSLDGVLVVREEVSDAMGAGRSDHIDFADLLERSGVALPFEGSIWVGTTPASGISFMGLQGIIFDWYGPAHLASVHGMRDFGNSNHDTMWSDLVLPKVVNTERFVTRIAVLNATGDGVAEALNATPQVIIRDDDGVELVNTTLDELAPYCATIFAVDELEGGESVETGSIQIREAEAGLVVMAFLHDRDNDGFAAADHFFDRHFVTTAFGFTG